MTKWAESEDNEVLEIV